MMRRRSGTDIEVQRAISASVRLQPAHNPLAGSITQTLTHGLSMALPS